MIFDSKLVCLISQITHRHKNSTDILYLKYNMPKLKVKSFLVLEIRDYVDPNASESEVLTETVGLMG